MNIGARRIGAGHRPYVIAELGVNHDGDAGRAMELTRAASWAGADAVKLQYFRADTLMSGAAGLAGYQRRAGERDPREMLRRLELEPGAMGEVVGLAHRLGMHAIVTVFSLGLVGEIDRIPWDAYKTASPDLIHRPLLERVSASGRPMIVSTGAATPAEITRAVGWLAGARDRTALLQCVSSYPASMEDAELGVIPSFAPLGVAAVGYSDHTREVETGALAVEHGAVILEKHLTLSRSAPGPDHAASLEPEGMRTYIALARNARVKPDLPARPKRVLPCEEDVRRLSRQSVVARRAIRAGEVIRREDLEFKRPGTGVPPFMVDRVAGARAVRDIPADAPIEASAIHPWITPISEAA
ncbi:MAG: N-acetylneuraminate synthase family protein [Phycisphaeraceae bacterium]|nr:MAG: N-acetylneuraminate synthase family protein [Phycisphaeraceae bacterium]